MVFALSIRNDELERQLTKTNITCGFCGDKLHLTEEVWQLVVVQPELRENLEFHHVIGYNGGLAYEPHVFEFMCWEQVEEFVHETMEDTPPVLDEIGLLCCDLCGSHIREWELMGLVKFGELHCSQKTPNGEITYKFEPMGVDRHVCVGCLTHANDEYELWQEDLEGLPGTETCRDGIFERCWRKNMCECKWRNE